MDAKGNVSSLGGAGAQAGQAGFRDMSALEIAAELGIEKYYARVIANRKGWKNLANHPNDPARYRVPLDELEKLQSKMGQRQNGKRSRNDSGNKGNVASNVNEGTYERVLKALEQRERLWEHERTRLLEEMEHERQQAQTEKERLLNEIKTLKKEIDGERNERKVDKTKIEGLHVSLLKITNEKHEISERVSNLEKENSNIKEENSKISEKNDRIMKRSLISRLLNKDA